MGTQMPDQATTTEQEAQGQVAVDELIDSFGDPIDNFGELPAETPPVEPAGVTPAPEPAPEPSTVQPAAGDAIPPAVTPAAPGSGEGAPPAQPGAQSPVSLPDELLTLSGLSEQQAREVFGTPDKLLQAMSDFDRRMFDAGRQLVAGGPPARPTPPAAAPPQPATTPPVATPPPQPAAPAPAAKPPLVEPFKLDKPEEWDATTRKLVEDMNAHWAKQIEKHAQQVLQLQQLLVGTLEIERQRAEQRFLADHQFTGRIRRRPSLASLSPSVAPAAGRSTLPCRRASAPREMCFQILAACRREPQVRVPGNAPSPRHPRSSPLAGESSQDPQPAGTRGPAVTRSLHAWPRLQT